MIAELDRCEARFWLSLSATTGISYEMGSLRSNAKGDQWLVTRDGA